MARDSHLLPAFAGWFGLLLAMTWLSRPLAHEGLVAVAVVAAFAYWATGIYRLTRPGDR